ENPAMGWRAIRMAIDRPELFRVQARAMLKAAGAQELRIMIPMVSSAAEIDAIRALIDKETAFLARHNYPLPSKIYVGAMLEVPALLFELDAFLPKVDFISVGSNDLMQFLYAADRTNARVASRFDALSPAALRALRSLVKAAKKHRVPLTLCGEMAGRPVEAMALVGLGFRSLSMAPAAIGPVKAMILSLDVEKLTVIVDDLLKDGARNARTSLIAFAQDQGVELET
ncbi:MAG: putative PEP-binding protein, partial [Hyphomicrobium sp.]